MLSFILRTDILIVHCALLCGAFLLLVYHIGRVLETEQSAATLPNYKISMWQVRAVLAVSQAYIIIICTRGCVID